MPSTLQHLSIETMPNQCARVGSQHPLREELHNEFHARPSLYFDGDTDVWHLAILGDDTAPVVPAAFVDLAEVTTTQDGSHGTGYDQIAGH